MTNLCVDPAGLKLQLPKATPVHPKKIRLIGQVLYYDEDTALLYVGRVANLGPVHVHVSLEGEDEEKDASACVDVSQVLQFLDRETTVEGAVVSIWGIYDGLQIQAVECIGVNGQALLGGSASVMAEFSQLRRL